MDASFDVKEQIRDAIDIVDLVSRYVPSLRRQGRNFVGSCPWHDDARPSLQINPDRQTFKCWVCDLGGDIFSFMMQMENVDFRQSLEMLADMAGIPLPEARPFRKQSDGAGEENFSGRLASGDVSCEGDSRDSSGGASSEITKPVLYRAMDWLAGEYHRCFLNDPEAEPARKYIHDRGISPESVRRFRIGYAPLRAQTVIDWVGGDRNRVRILEAAGVLARRADDFLPTGNPTIGTLSVAEKERVYDRFRGRVLFPIRDTQDRCVAFGGRILPNSTLNSPAKYVNSPETLIFRKSKMLYGLDKARNSIRKKKRVLITEGYTDCIMAHQFGLDETVAVLGTALGEEHVKMLNRFADRIYLILDGDEAGRRRAEEVLGLFVAQGADMAILTLPENLDPCDFLLSRGVESFETMIETSAVDALDHAFETATAGIDLSRDVVAASRSLDKMLSIIALFPDHAKNPADPVRIRLARTVQRLAERFRIREEEIRRNLKEHRDRLRNQPIRNTEGVKTPTPPTAILPGGEFRDETENMLQERFGVLPPDVWSRPNFLPNPLERDMLEFWFTCPERFGALAESVFPDDFRSPITGQLFRLGLDLLNRGYDPTFDRLLLRYDDTNMKNFLVGVDRSAGEKNLPERLTTPPVADGLLREIVGGFLRQRIAVAEPRQVGDLRAETLSQAEKLSRLLEIREQQLKKQEHRTEAGLMGEFDSTEEFS